jgi:hypothetical protein
MDMFWTFGFICDIYPVWVVSCMSLASLAIYDNNNVKPYPNLEPKSIPAVHKWTRGSEKGLAHNLE